MLSGRGLRYLRSNRGFRAIQGSAKMLPLSAHETLFWRRAARWGATRAPWWFQQYAPPVIGWAAAAALPWARRAVKANLHRVRGDAPPLRDARDVLATFGAYASCLSEALANDTEEGRAATRVDVANEGCLEAALADGKGLVIVTAHTAGWDVVGPSFSAKHGLRMVLVTRAEADEGAGSYHDERRRRAGVEVAHVGDPLASLPLLRQLKAGGVVALQLDRRLPEMRALRVPLLGDEGVLPEGPFRLAQVSGAPILPVFCERLGYRHYRVHVYEPRRLARRATKAEVDEVARHVAWAMTDFLRKHPTQWFHFQG